MRIAVTGANGHVGRNLVRGLLEQGDQVRAFDLGGFEGADPAVEAWPGDVRDEERLSRCYEGVERVYHLAAIISVDGDRGGLVTDVNVNGARASASAALRAGVRRFVHFSSIEAFETKGRSGSVDEELPRSTGSDCPAYDRSKAQGEAEVRKLVEQGLDAVVVHPTGVFGPKDQLPSRAGATFLDAARGRMPILVEGGFDWVDVRDIAAGAIAAGDRGRTGQSYILSGSHQTMFDLMGRFARGAGAMPPVVALPRWLLRPFTSLPSLVARMRGKEARLTAQSLEILGTRVRFSHERAARDLGYQPRPIEASVEDLLTDFVDSGWIRRGDPRAGSDALIPELLLQLRSHQVDGEREREILARALLEVARADGQIADAERALISQFASSDDDGTHPLLTVDEARALPRGLRESILAVAAAVACVDEDYSAVERDAVERLRARLDIQPARGAQLEQWAREFVVDQLFDAFYADGVLDPEEAKRVEQAATGLGLSPQSVARLGERARQRRAPAS